MIVAVKEVLPVGLKHSWVVFFSFLFFFGRMAREGGLTQHETGDGSLLDVGRAADRLQESNFSPPPSSLFAAP